MKLFKFNFLILIQFMALSAMAQMTTTFPIHENVRHGKLDNGMTYYILHNEEPKDRASFYFVQNVGAILEEDSQNGLAHFLEHMAFNGTQHFKGKGILNFLEKHGVRFGADINAYTALDETVYNLSSVPTDKEGLMDSCLLVLHDWSGYLLLEEAEIDAERGVIKEEWRTRRDSRFRINSQTRPVLFSGSKYAVRDVIGDLEVISNFHYDALRDYYHKWYRPDLQAVVVVGDVNVDEMEAKIKKRFSTIPLPADSPERPYYNLPDNEELLFTQATDVEAQAISLALVYKKESPKVKDMNYYRTTMMETMYQGMISDRFRELTQKPESNSFSLFAGFFSMTRTGEVFYLNATPKQEKAKESFRELLTEVQRVKLHGFTSSELERTQQKLLNQYKNAFENSDKVTNDRWARQLGDHFLKAEPVFSPQKEYELAKSVIESITLSELNAWAAAQQTSNNQVIMITGPESEKESLPTKEELESILAEIETTEIEAYAEEEDETPLVAEDLLKGSKIKNAFEVKGIKTTSFVLENGAKVILMPTTYSKDEILFEAYSYGGKSVLAQELLASADAATSIARASGIGEFDAVKLNKKLSGKTLKINPYITDFNEGLSGSCAMKDFESLLQMTYLYFEAPRFDNNVFNITREQWANYAKNRIANNMEAFRDSVSMMYNNRSQRTSLFNPNFVEQLDFEKVEKVFTSRFQNASDFTFVFVGNIEPKEAKPLIEKYLGSIKSTGATEQPVDHNMRPAKGNHKLLFNKEMEVPKATVSVNMNGELPFNLENRLYIRTLEQLLSKRYLETIREEEGGTYGVGVRGTLNRVPKNEYRIFLQFDCDPEKQERLLSIVWKEIEAIKNGTIVAKDLNEIKQNMIKMRKEQVVKNDFWLSEIVSSLKADTQFTDDAEFERIVNSITEKSVAKVAKKVFGKMNTTEVIMKP